MRVAPTGEGYMGGWAGTAVPSPSHAATTAPRFHHLLMSSVPLSTANPSPPRVRPGERLVLALCPVAIDHTTAKLETFRTTATPGTTRAARPACLLNPAPAPGQRPEDG